MQIIAPAPVDIDLMLMLANTVTVGSITALAKIYVLCMKVHINTIGQTNCYYSQLRRKKQQKKL